ncbi:MAG: alanine--tRNA ligase [Acidimicrobiales bacterium]|nr:alanine--tRNA ligase [Acidimicrobiales bacterium]
MNAKELRAAFVDFFAERGHTKVDSSSLIPHDNTLLFTNAGMVPFKPFFVGDETPPYNRAVSIQKCVRAGGKHNDLDEVGRTTRHLTFFEMMGNFSFGDYFKSDAIPFAWEFVTEVLKLDTDRLWVTVHLTDDEAEAIWRDDVGVSPDRIQRLDEDNWWRMADTGPNGPCSEIFYDLGAEYGDDGGPAHGGEDRFIEIWNLVFMQFDQQADGRQIPLPKPSIDTGAGLERTLSVLQGVDSVFGTDEFQTLLATASEVTGVADGAAPASDVSLRILADHARSTTMLVSDGVVPSNEDRGFVLRRILRRAVRHAYLLGVETPVMPQMVDTVVTLLGDNYPDLVKNHDRIRSTIEREELSFRQTLASGSAMLDARFAELEPGGALPGEVAFELHDTYGFPLEVTREIAAERGFDVDVEGFDAAMADQRGRAKAAHAAKSGASDVDVSAFRGVADSSGDTEFTGRAELESTATVLLVTDDSIVLDRTPFYAESGGQIGDTGTIATSTGTATVSDTTYALPGVVRHHIAETTGSIEVGQEATAAVDAERRGAIARNHTATHILHWALRLVVGSHAQQQGSWVGPDRLRFDFNHFEALTAEQLAEIEDRANAEILGNASCRHYETTKDEAEAAGAIAFFGDKYGDIVRVLEAGRNSIELCGGTHVGALGDIGPLKIISESSIGSNLRRVEAITGAGPIERLRQREATLAELAELVGVPVPELADGLRKRLADTKALRKKVAELEQAAALGSTGDLVNTAVDGVVVARVDGLDQAALRDLAVAVRDDVSIKAVVLGSAPSGGGAALAAAVTDDSGFDAGELIAEGKKAIQGGGRPAPDLATAGGKNPDGLDDALDAARAAAGLSA